MYTVYNRTVRNCVTYIFRITIYINMKQQLLIAYEVSVFDQDSLMDKVAVFFQGTYGVSATSNSEINIC
jgi:hypothetical protein